MTESKAVQATGISSNEEDLADMAKVFCLRRGLDQQFAYLESHPFDAAAKEKLLGLLGSEFDEARAAWLRMVEEGSEKRAS